MPPHTDISTPAADARARVNDPSVDTPNEDGALALTLDPEPRSWRGMVRTPPSDARSRRFREQLALPTNMPIVMSGHQAQLWHPGILAKLFAAQSLARRTGAAIAWLVVDHDHSRPFQTRLPARDEHARLRNLDWPLDGERGAHPSVPLEARAITPHDPTLPRGWSLDGPFGARADELVASMSRHSSAPNAAVQVTRATLDLLDDVLGVPAPIVVYDSDLARTDLFAEIIERARTRPQAMHSIYNDVVARFPQAELRALRTDPDLGHELPLWKRVAGHGTTALFESDLDDLPPEAMLPRALLTTGMMRLAGCDLFIHGTGGRLYEPVNDAWLPRWLSADQTNAGLAPFTTASADLPLDLPGELVTLSDAARARWRAHHARHHPIELGDADAQRERDALVAQIARAPRASTERRALYARLHELLDRHARAQESRLTAMGEHARDLTHAASDAELRTDRTWPFFLHPHERLAALRNAIDARL
ncbi:MAG: hypothetical protein RBS39_02020 [Phycisphaerales bacterium]|jgi:hypothetical protein|nr:hypothetical protein [Phycisphaerales bacterium]